MECRSSPGCDARSLGRTQGASISLDMGATEDVARGRAARPGGTDCISPNPPASRTMRCMRRAVTVACVQAEPVILDRDATIEKLASLAAEAAGNGAKLLVFPETFIPAYPSSVWARALAGWSEPGAKEAFALLARESLEFPSEAADRLAEIAREHEVWLVTGVSERDPERPGTLYNTLLYHGPDGSVALKHRKLVPTNHERLGLGQGGGEGLRAFPTDLGRPR